MRELGIKAEWILPEAPLGDNILWEGGGLQKDVCVYAKLLQSCLTLCGSMNVAWQAPLFMEFSRQEYWSGLPCPPLGDIPNPGVEQTSLKPLALAGGFFAASTTC